MALLAYAFIRRHQLDDLKRIFAAFFLPTIVDDPFEFCDSPKEIDDGCAIALELVRR